MDEADYVKQLNEEKTKRYKQGVEKLEWGEYEEAVRILFSLKEDEPDFVPVYNKLAIIAIHQEDLDRARQLLQNALEMDGEFAPALTNLGSIYKKGGDNKRARELYEQAIQVDEDYGPAYNNLGVIMREEKQYRESVKYLRKANKLNSYTVDTGDKPLYKQPGCLVTLIILAGIVVLYLLFLH